MSFFFFLCFQFVLTYFATHADCNLNIKLAIIFLHSLIRNASPSHHSMYAAIRKKRSTAIGIREDSMSPKLLVKGVRTPIETVLRRAR